MADGLYVTIFENPPTVQGPRYLQVYDFSGKDQEATINRATKDFGAQVRYQNSRRADLKGEKDALHGLVAKINLIVDAANSSGQFNTEDILNVDSLLK